MRIQKLFARFDEVLRAAGYIAMGGQIVDGSLMAAPAASRHNHSQTATQIYKVRAEKTSA